MRNSLLIRIAFRYWRSKKSFSIVNIISGISFWGIAIGTAALIIVLSVFNGFESMVREMFNTFNPDFRVVPMEGKSFHASSIDMSKIATLPGVDYCGGVFEEVALLRYGEKQQVVRVKGIPADGELMHSLESSMLDGDYSLGSDSAPKAVVGAGIVYKLGISLHDPSKLLQLLSPSHSVSAGTDISSDFDQVFLRMSGFFSIQQDFDDNYLIVPRAVCDSLFESQGKYSAIEILASKSTDFEKLENQISGIVGDKFNVKNRFEQEEALFKIMKTEKLVVFVILAFILLLASINIISTLGLLILDKRLDSSVLNALGLSLTEIKKVFRLEGILIIAIGTLTGLLIGTVVVLLQLWFGLVPMNGGDSILMSSYPVKIVWTDYILISSVIIVFGFILVRIPVKKINTAFLSVRKHQN